MGTRGSNGMNGNAPSLGQPQALLRPGMMARMISEETVLEAEVTPQMGVYGPEIRIVIPISSDGLVRALHVPTDLAQLRLLLAGLGQQIGEPGDVAILDTPVPDDLESAGDEPISYERIPDAVPTIDA